MRSDRVASIISTTAALVLLSTGVVAAQAATPPPQEVGRTLKTAVVTSALDAASTNRLILEQVLERHEGLGGKTDGKQGKWTPIDPLPSSESVVQAVLDLAQLTHDVIVISGGDAAANVSIARSFPETTFLDLGQRPPCVTLDGQFDPSGACSGGDLGIPFNYTSIDFAVEDGAFLAGLLAAAASREDRIGIISGATDCEPCNRYVQGFVNGARSVDPEIDIELVYLADDEVGGFSDAASAATFTRAFLDVHQPDVLLPVGRGATSGMIEAACERGDVLVVGTGVDVARERPELADCVLTSVTVDLATAVRDGMNTFANGITERVVTYDIVNGGVGVEFPQRAALPVDTAERFEAARTGLLTGQIDSCPVDCGGPVDLGIIADTSAAPDRATDPDEAEVTDDVEDADDADSD